MENVNKKNEVLTEKNQQVGEILNTEIKQIEKRTCRHKKLTKGMNKQRRGISREKGKGEERKMKRREDMNSQELYTGGL